MLVSESKVTYQQLLSANSQVTQLGQLPSSKRSTMAFCGRRGGREEGGGRREGRNEGEGGREGEEIGYCITHWYY